MTQAKKPVRQPKATRQTAEDIATLKMVAIAAAEAVYHYRLIGRAIGRGEDALADWRADDKEFSARLEEARFRFLNKQIRKSKPEFLLERLEPDVFKQRTDITSGDRPLPTALVEFVGGDTTTSKD